MARLGEAHIEQAKVLKAEGKSAREIAEVLSTTYSIKISQWDVYAALGKGKKAVADPQVKKNRAYLKKIAVKATPIPTTKSDINDIIALLGEIDKGYKQVFAFLRTELIKSRAEVYQMLKGAGIEVSVSEIE